MTDEELIARLRDEGDESRYAFNEGADPRLCAAAADRITALLARAEAAEKGADEQYTRMLDALTQAVASRAAMKAERDAERETVARLAAENAELREEVKAYLAVWADEHARRGGLPEGHLHPAHYDRMAELGCRMEAFTRAALTQKEPTNG